MCRYPKNFPFIFLRKGFSPADPSPKPSTNLSSTSHQLPFHFNLPPFSISKSSMYFFHTSFQLMALTFKSVPRLFKKFLHSNLVIFAFQDTKSIPTDAYTNATPETTALWMCFPHACDSYVFQVKVIFQVWYLHLKLEGQFFSV